MNVIVHYPKSKTSIDILKKRVAEIHARVVVRYIRELACPYNQKVKLLKKIYTHGKSSNTNET